VGTVSSLIPRLQMKTHSVPSTMAELALRDAVRELCNRTGVWRQWVVAPAGRPLGSILLMGQPTSGDYVTLDDGTNSEVTLTFGTDVTIGATVAATVTNLIAAVNAATLSITASADSTNTSNCLLAHDDVDEEGNVDIEYEGANIQVTGMSSSLYRISLSGLVTSGTAPVAQKILEVWVSGAQISSSEFRFDYDTQTLSFNSDLSEDEPDGLKVLVEVEPAMAQTIYPDWLIGERYANAIIGGALFELLTTPGRPYTDPGAAMKFKQDFNLGICRARADRDTLFTSRNGSWVNHESNSGGMQG
jgi:hypothetical protein